MRRGEEEEAVFFCSETSISLSLFLLKKKKKRKQRKTSIILSIRVLNINPRK